MTSDEPTVPPISKIHDDILWSIFQLNSYLVTDSSLACADILSLLSYLEQSNPSLVTNRRTSQVCRRWRKLALNSPTIWANTIDLRHLNQQGDEWRNEVLKRTGHAPLTIAGEVGKGGYLIGYNLHTIPFILELLSAQWNRVRTLILFSRDTMVHEALRLISSCQAPSLEIFVIGWDANWHDLHRVPNSIPFEDYAPRLRTLNARCLSFDLAKPSWSSNLRHLNFGWSRRDMSITELLLGLENMIFLETLYLWDITPNSDIYLLRPNGTIPTITFSSLKKLAIEDETSPVPDFISHIIVRPQCSLEIMTALDDHVNAQAPEHIARCCTTFLQNNFSPRDVIDLYYSLEYIPEPEELEGGAPEGSDYQLVISLNRKASKKISHFQYIVNMLGPGAIPFCMARTLSSYDLSNITTFTLMLNLREHDDILERPLFEHMHDLFLSLKSVGTLHTNDKTLRFCMRSVDFAVNTLLFPRLVNIFTDIWDTGINGFLEYRYENFKDKAINRLVFEDISTTPLGFPPALNVASKLGFTVGWKGKSLKKVSIAEDGVLEFAP